MTIWLCFSIKIVALLSDQSRYLCGYHKWCSYYLDSWKGGCCGRYLEDVKVGQSFLTYFHSFCAFARPSFGVFNTVYTNVMYDGASSLPRFGLFDKRL